jgi:hypothetical protein
VFLVSYEINLYTCSERIQYFDVNNGKLLERERQMTDPTSRQRGRPKKTRQQISENNFLSEGLTRGRVCRQRGRPKKTRQQISENNLPTESNIWSQVPEWARYLDIMTD